MSIFDNRKSFKGKRAPRTKPIDIEAAETMDYADTLLAKPSAQQDMTTVYNEVIDETVDNILKRDAAFTTPNANQMSATGNFQENPGIFNDPYGNGGDSLVNEQLTNQDVMDSVVQDSSANSTKFLIRQYDRLKNEVGYEMPSQADFLANMNLWADKVAGIESSGGVNLSNPESTAKGRYQFTDASVPVMKQRLRNTGVDESIISKFKDNPKEWTPEQEDLAFFGNIASQDDSDLYMRNIGMGDISAMSEGYKKFHHTETEENPITDEILKNMKQWGL